MTMIRAARSMLIPALFLAYALWATFTVADSGQWWGLPVCVLGLALACGMLAWRIRSFRADPYGRLRAELAAVIVALGDNKIWLNRDEHQIFMSYRKMTAWHLGVFGEDDISEIQRGGMGALTGTDYAVDSIVGGVMRKVWGGRFRVDGDDVTDTTVRPSRREEARHYVSSFRVMFTSALFIPDRSELEQVIASARGAECLGDLPRS